MQEKWILVNEETGRRVADTPVFPSKPLAETAAAKQRLTETKDGAPQPKIIPKQLLEG